MPMTPSVLSVNQCSNWAALDLNLIHFDGKTIEVEAVDYRLSSQATTTPLATVKTYCVETHDPVLVFISATVTLASGKKIELTEDGHLGAYGLTLEGLRTADPTLTVQTTVSSLAGATADLVLNAMVA